MFAEAVVAGVEEEGVEAGPMDVRPDGQHQGSVPSPTMEHHDGGGRAVDGNPPGVETGPVGAVEPHLLFGQPEIVGCVGDLPLGRREGLLEGEGCGQVHPGTDNA